MTNRVLIDQTKPRCSAGLIVADTIATIMLCAGFTAWAFLLAGIAARLAWFFLLTGWQLAAHLGL